MMTMACFARTKKIIKIIAGIISAGNDLKTIY